MKTTTLVLTVWFAVAPGATIARALEVSGQSEPSKRDDPGKDAFISNSCNRCHAVESEGIEATAKSKRVRGPDLSTIAKSRDAEWLAKYVEKQTQANDKDHPVAWKGSDEDLEAIATWLASLE